MFVTRVSAPDSAVCPPHYVLRPAGRVGGKRERVRQLAHRRADRGARLSAKSGLSRAESTSAPPTAGRRDRNSRCARRSSRDPPSTPRKASASPTRPCATGFTRSNHNVVIENERADVKAATRNAVDRQRCGSHLFIHRLGRTKRVPGISNRQEPTFRPERCSRPAKPTAPRRPPRRANTRVRASWTRQGLLGPSQLNRDAQSRQEPASGDRSCYLVWVGWADLGVTQLGYESPPSRPSSEVPAFVFAHGLCQGNGGRLFVSNFGFAH